MDLTQRRFKLRKATTEDLDSLTKIQMAAFPSDPQWDYRFPHREKHSDDTKKYTRLRFESFLKDDRYRVVLAEIYRTEDEKTMWPVAFAVWEDWQRAPMAVAPSTDGDERRRDANRLHVEVFRVTLTNARKRLFDDDHHIQLLLLGTHPEYRKQGLGSSLCKQGMGFAKDENAYVSVFGSPMGKELYESLGFRELESIEVRAPGEKQTLSISAMTYPGLISEPHHI